MNPMQRPMRFFGAGLFCVLVFNAAIAQTPLETEAQKLGYTIGMDIGNSIKQQGGELDLDALFAAITDVVEGRDTQLSPEEAIAIREAFMQRRRAEAAQEREQLASNNLSEGQAFLTENATKSDVLVTDTGLQYQVVEAGDGAKPTATDRVTVHYRGSLLDGREFDSSFSRGQPATFALNQVIPGWTEGVQLMSPGAKYKFFVPADLAYGERGAGQLIGPNAALIFEVELISVDSSANQ